MTPTTTPQPAPVLKLSGTTLHRGGTRVLSRLELAVGSGEHWVILGPNGSGKSTLIAMLQGLLWPQEGSVTVLGTHFGEEDITELRRHVGWVSSEIESRFQGDESAWDIVRSGTVGTIGLQFERPTAGQLKRVRSLINEMGLKSLMQKPFRHLSQGQKRLISIARAMLTEPRILLLDEACAGLDPVARETFLQKLKVLGGLPGGPAMLMATHHVEEIREPFSHVLMLKEGRIFQAGPMAETLISRNISSLFGKKLKLKKYAWRYRLEL